MAIGYKYCIDVIEQEGRFQIAGIIDLPEKARQNILGYKMYRLNN